MKILIINSMSGKGSTGRIAEGIANVLLSRKHEVRIAYGLEESSYPYAYKFGSKTEQFVHKCLSHAFDMQGLGSQLATRQLIKSIKDFRPDLINIHTIHGNYLNYPMLFKFLAEEGIRIVWSLHDCWTFTGHCPHFIYQGCFRWRDEGCHNCPQLYVYPKSDFWDGSKRNFFLKKKYFSQLSPRPIITTDSEWLAVYVKQSFLNYADVRTLYNGIDVSKYTIRKDANIIRDKYSIPDKEVVIAVAAPWTDRKGWKDMIQLRNILDFDHFHIVIVGVSNEQRDSLPSGITGILRTESMEELAALYSLASVFVNPTYEDCFGMVNVEAQACGTPVITYKTGGTPEAITASTGIVVEQGNVAELAKGVQYICSHKDEYSESNCRNQAVLNFSQEDAFAKYASLFESLAPSK